MPTSDEAERLFRMTLEATKRGWLKFAISSASLIYETQRGHTLHQIAWWGAHIDLDLPYCAYTDSNGTLHLFQDPKDLETIDMIETDESFRLRWF